MTDSDRDLGVEIGELEGELEQEEYPITAEELIETYGDQTLETSGGTQTLAEVLEPIPDEEFQNAAGVKQAIVGFVDREAIGRPRYSDRTPPAMGEETESDEESF